MTHFISLLVFEYVFRIKRGQQVELNPICRVWSSPWLVPSHLFQRSLLPSTVTPGEVEHPILALGLNPWHSLWVSAKLRWGLRPHFKTLIAHLITILIVSDSVFRDPLGSNQQKKTSERAEVCLFLWISVHGNNVTREFWCQKNNQHNKDFTLQLRRFLKNFVAAFHTSHRSNICLFKRIHERSCTSIY